MRRGLIDENQLSAYEDSVALQSILACSILISDQQSFFRRFGFVFPNQIEIHWRKKILVKRFPYQALLTGSDK